MSDLNKILITKPEHIKSIVDLEIILNDTLNDFGQGKKSKKDTMDKLIDVITHMMAVAKRKLPFDAS